MPTKGENLFSNFVVSKKLANFSKILAKAGDDS
jgi:hypothetical protein